MKPEPNLKRKPKKGDKIKTWFSDQEDGMSTVIEAYPYTGCYPQYFMWVVRCTASRTKRGWMEIVI